MQLEQAKSRAEAANKFALEVEKERDAAEKAVEELKRQMYPKRAHTHDDVGDGHEMLAEVDNWDLRDHRQQATRVQNCRNVCVVEDTDPTPVDQISWWKVVRAPSRPFGQKTSLLSQYHQGFGIVT